MQIQRCNSIGYNQRRNSAQKVNFKSMIVQNPGQFATRLHSSDFYKAIDSADCILGKKINAVLSQGDGMLTLALQETPERASMSIPWKNIKCNVPGKFEEALVSMASDIVRQLS